jgi:hypothetical protein
VEVGREVEAGHLPAGPYGSGRHQADGTVPAPDIQDPLARFEDGGRQQAMAEGGEHGVEALGLGGRQAQGIDWTAGCIAVSDEDIDYLFAVVPVGAPVTIHD